jgi:hypothetical protein
MNAKEMVGEFGTVVVPCTDESGSPSSVSFPIAPLSIAEELDFEGEIRATVQAERTAVQNAKLIELGDIDRPTWAHRQFVTELVQYVMSPVNGYEIDQQRITLSGTRSELWHRGRKSNPALKREHVAACVTGSNWADVREQITAIIKAAQKATKSEAVRS